MRSLVKLVLILFLNSEAFSGDAKNRFKINPKIYDEAERKFVTSTFKNGFHIPNIRIDFEMFQKEVSIELELNYEVLSQNHGLFHQGKNGEIVKVHLENPTENFCHYRGKISDIDDSRAAISTCDGLNGVIYDGEQFYDIDNGQSGGHYLSINNDSSNQIGMNSSLMTNKVKRATMSQLKGPYNSNQDSYFVELCLVFDNNIYNDFKKDKNKIHEFAIDVVNIMNVAYNRLNIFIILVGVMIWDKNNEIEISSNASVTLNDFSNYRIDRLLTSIPNDNSQLITSKKFGEGTLGLAHVGTICYKKCSCGVNSKLYSGSAVFARTMAHEMGHNFGMRHDDDKCKCTKKKCLMYTTSSQDVALDWSECSVQQIQDHMKTKDISCLKNKPKIMFKTPFCGNGFVEAGEECDCGLPEYCASKCCDPKTCKFFANATCATGECCDKNSCQLKEAGSPCRKAKSDCDLPEYCTGNDEFCPDDFSKIDATPCKKGSGYCFRGECESRDDHCRNYWGPECHSNSKCYSNNKLGIEHANCGQDVVSGRFIRCGKENVECGILQCANIGNLLGDDGTLGTTYSEWDIYCKVVTENYNSSFSQAVYVKNGVKCDEGKMCYNRECRSIQQLQDKDVIIKCSANCNGNGVCNSLGHCHCDTGFAPPDCYGPGPGGSVDSGPNTKPREGMNLTLILLLVLMTIILIVTPLIYSYRCIYKKKNTSEAYWIGQYPIGQQASKIEPLKPDNKPLPVRPPPIRNINVKFNPVPPNSTRMNFYAPFPQDTPQMSAKPTVMFHQKPMISSTHKPLRSAPSTPIKSGNSKYCK